MIYVGIDDTDTLDSPGTNQLARAIVRAASADWRCRGILRHQLLDDPRIPYTSKNGSASITLQSRNTLVTSARCGNSGADGRLAPASIPPLIELCRGVMLEWFVEGSDPGLCVTDNVPDAVTQFGRRCQREVVTQHEARVLAADHGIHLEGLGGTQGGVIGALCAVGLVVTGDDGRVVQFEEWPDDLSGLQGIGQLHDRHIEVLEISTGRTVHSGLVDVGKHLRPNRRGGRTVLFVHRPDDADDKTPYLAVKVT